MDGRKLYGIMQLQISNLNLDRYVKCTIKISTNRQLNFFRCAARYACFTEVDAEWLECIDLCTI